MRRAEFSQRLRFSNKHLRKYTFVLNIAKIGDATLQLVPCGKFRNFGLSLSTEWSDMKTF